MNRKTPASPVSSARDGMCRGLGLYLVFLLVVSGLSLPTPPRVHADSIFSSLQEAREYRTAVGLLKQGDYDLARTQYRSFIQDYPDSNRLPRAYFGLAESFYLQEHYKKAARVYLRSLEQGRLSDTYHQQALKRGLDAVNRSHQYHLAQQYIDQIDESMQRVTDQIMRRIVQVLAKNDQAALALKWAKKRYERNPKSDYWRYETAVLLADVGRHDAALDRLQPLLVGESRYKNDATYLMAEIYYDTGQYNRARQYYSDLISDSGYRDDARYGLAWIDVKERNIDRAKQTLRSLTESSTVFNNLAARDLARLYRAEANDSRTRHWYKQALQWSEDPRRSRLHIEFGDYYVNTDRLPRAIPHYEAARSLGLKGKKRLIRGYLVQEDYHKTVKTLRGFQENGQLTGPTWNRRLALAYYHLGHYRQALAALPAIEKARNQEDERKILSLKGSLLFRLDRLEESRRIYERMSRQFSVIEPKYYFALLSERLDDPETAIDRLQSLQETVHEEPWQSRIKYQLARLHFESGRFDRYSEHISGIDPSVLSTILRTEVKILKLADRIRLNPRHRSLVEPARSLRTVAEKYEVLDQWYGSIAQLHPPVFWWDDLLLPTLREEKTIQPEWGPRTVELLREQKLLDRSLGVGKDFLATDRQPNRKRDLLAEVFTTLRARNDHRLLGQYLPSDSDWGEWHGSNRRSLAHALASFHRSMDQPTRGRESLQRIHDNTDPNETTLRATLQEWIASFEIELGRYESAKTRLESIDSPDRSDPGELNLAIARYHLGDTTTSFAQIRDLYREGDFQSLSLYDYGFRILRDRHTSGKLDRWSQNFLSRDDHPETETRTLLLDNVRYWINNGHIQLGLEYLDRLENRSRSRRALVPIQYYRAMAYFNDNRLDRAQTRLSSLEDSFDLDDRWLQRVVRSQVQIDLRRNDWSLAYEDWGKLHDRGFGGEVGARLLTLEGLRSAPEDFNRLLETMQDNYPEYLSRGEGLFWRARLDDHRGQRNRAIKQYERYLNAKQYTDHSEQASRRIAELYDQLGNHEQSLEYYRTLYDRTNQPNYRIKAGVQLRKMGRFEESRSVLNTVRDESPALKPLVDYQLGYTYLEEDRTEKAYRSFRESLKGLSDPKQWSGDARRRSIELALRLEKPHAAEYLMESLDTGPERILFRAELFRQRGDLDNAKSELSSLPEDLPESFQRGRYRRIASAVYWQSEDYNRVLAIFGDLPKNPRHQQRYVKSLVRTGQLERARATLPAVRSTVRNDLRLVLADAYYDGESWQDAISQYRQLPNSLRTQFRIGNSYRKLDEPKKAFDTWKQALLDADPSANPDWLQTIVDGVGVLTDSRGYWSEAATTLDRTWDRPYKNRDNLASQGLKWALETQDFQLANRFMARIEQPDRSTFESVARKLATNESWDNLETWLGTYEDSLTGDTNPMSLKYYRVYIRLKRGDRSVDPYRINDYLNEALQSRSGYASELQKLLGDYHFKQGNYQQAAIEYRKVDLLFENRTPDPRVQLKLARSYLRLGKPEKARSLFESLTTESVPETVRREAEQWLRQHSEES